MQSEVSIAKPLSGPECLESCLHALRMALSRDDRFMNHVAYTGFTATIDFKFRPSMSFVPDVERTVIVEEGDQTELEKEPTVEARVELTQRPPNQVREEAGMKQPVLVTDGQGNSREEWKRVAKVPRQGVIPTHNKVVGV
jgi:hypothetical protein